ncbi:hypothetical protein [Pectobacterium zantedeschiae]
MRDYFTLRERRETIIKQVLGYKRMSVSSA